MTIKEFHEVAQCLDYIIVERQIGKTECLLIDGANWTVSRPELATRKILSIYTNGLGHTIVEVAKAED